MNAQSSLAFPLEEALVHYENKVCTFCGQRTPRPCRPEEHRDCDDYQAQAKTPSNVVVLFN